MRVTVTIDDVPALNRLKQEFRNAAYISEGAQSLEVGDFTAEKGKLGWHIKDKTLSGFQFELVFRRMATASDIVDDLAGRMVARSMSKDDLAESLKSVQKNNVKSFQFHP